MGYINMKKFNKDKYLKKLRFKKYKRYLYIGIPCILVLLIGIYFAYSKFSVSKEEDVVRTTVGEFIHGDVVIGAYINGEYSNTIPGKDDGYIVEKVSCDNDAIGKWNSDDWGIMVTDLSKRTKCNVYFKKKPDSKVPEIIAQLDTSGKCPTVNDDGSVNVTGVEATNGYLCKAKDAYGDSYYYRGNVTNNYVKFADKYWRIVRINGDGTVRVIYDGTSAHANGEASADRQIGTSAFNGGYTDNAYVGYMYNINIIDDSTYENNAGGLEKYEFYISKTYSYDKGVFNLDNPIKINGKNLTDSYVGYYFAGYWNLVASSSELRQILAVHNSPTNVNVEYSVVSAKSESKETAQTNSRNSAIKTYLDTWYENNIKGTTNEQYIADNLFCNDRSFAPNNSGTGAGESKTYYRWSNFHGDRYNNKMMLTCPQKNDAFTVSDTTNGNGALTYGVGLVTTDEVVLAGGWSSSNSKYYLYSGQNYWTMSPNNFNDNYADERRVLSGGGAGNSTGYGYNVGDVYGARPVFNLKAEVLSQGTGTASDPYHLAS